MGERVLETIFRQLTQRVTSMGEEDLGLVLRALLDTKILAMQNLDWNYVTLALGDRLETL
jgi:hypothetical protein